jgi:hypothetical protein
MSVWAVRERRTAQCVRACYEHYVERRKPNAKKLYALCQLTWITGKEGSADNTRAVVSKAMSALTGADIDATTRKDLPEQLKAAGVPAEIVRLVTKPIGMVNFYPAFRNVALPWVRKHRGEVAKMAKLVAAAASDDKARSAYAMLDRFPRLPRAGGRNMPATGLFTPMLAGLDPRGRSPIINRRDEVQERLGLLGLRHATVADQFVGLVGLIGQAGIRDAFDLDTSNMKTIAKALRAKPSRRSTRPKRTAKPASLKTRTMVGKGLAQRDDADVEFFRQSGRAKMRRLHATMTNALRQFCKNRGLVVEQGSLQECMFDALIHEYDDERHLLIEVKTDSEQPTCRLGVGQLFDYRRQRDDRARIDLAVLFPGKPARRTTAFLDYVGVRTLWFARRMKAVTGLGNGTRG